MKLRFSQEIFEKHSGITFHENPSSESRFVPYGQMDEFNSRSSQSYEQA